MQFLRKTTVLDFISEVSKRVELCEALLRQNLDICTSGIYSSVVPLSDEIYKLSCEQLDSIVYRLRTFEETIEVYDGEKENAWKRNDINISIHHQ